jgi:hypothetical protein
MFVSGVFGGQRSGESAAGPVKPHSERAGADPQNPRGLLALQPIPGHEQQQISIPLAQRAKRLRYPGLDALEPQARIKDVLWVTAYPVLERDTPSITTTQVRQRASGDSQQPGELV